MTNPNALVEMTGTTLFAIKTADGVVFAADSRSTAGSTVACRTSNKITQISSKVFVARTGSTADTQALARYGHYILNVLTMNSESEVKRPVLVASQYLRKVLQSNKEYLSASLICGGIEDDGTPSLYEINTSGMAIPRDFCLNGSGSSYILAFCDEKYRDNMTMEEATKFAIEAVTNAIIRDGASGGFVNIVQVTKDQTKRFVVMPKDQPYNHSVVKT
ncbi:putative proteasome subunit beta type-1 [Tritrichomonas foetus]|uniref:proteasome endopeptidase complex n=1 Tax=Tritrichomonas foetus TaxID=1144522 RepID=A0A075KQM4_9EUKA|nr:20S proteasome subunit beta 1 [Tritrichomonas foetus]OHT16537.1 putative proteasome subunit beta type-1 [Tritrichomonas foetus]|eukprot:OHT16537.1 putative proteasome subunit beta type-1 [Tritrichomonas foetus]